MDKSKNINDYGLGSGNNCDVYVSGIPDYVD